MNGPKSVKRRSQQQKLMDRRRHLFRRHGVSWFVAKKLTYFECGMQHMIDHLRRSMEEAKRHNA